YLNRDICIDALYGSQHPIRVRYGALCVLRAGPPVTSAGRCFRIAVLIVVGCVVTELDLEHSHLRIRACCPERPAEAKAVSPCRDILRFSNGRDASIERCLQEDPDARASV